LALSILSLQGECKSLKQILSIHDTSAPRVFSRLGNMEACYLVAGCVIKMAGLPTHQLAVKLLCLGHLSLILEWTSNSTPTQKG